MDSSFQQQIGEAFHRRRREGYSAEGAVICCMLDMSIRMESLSRAHISGALLAFNDWIIDEAERILKAREDLENEFKS